ncbi:MAG: DUF11 domain-containing protein, partial [Bifidobacteriaceae bacterium]|nr:DUF11 domain-containing protein [Bifidobacteriaceae bacterium]
MTYTVTVATPVGDASSTQPATIRVRDDLAAVLDGAVFLDASASDTAEPHGVFTLDGTELNWVGPPPAPGKSVELTYSVLIDDTADREFWNVAWVDNPAFSGAITCAIAGTSGRDPVTDEPCATHSFDAPALQITKTSTHKSSDRAGAVVTYTVTATNIGPGDYTAAAPAWVLDDLSGLIDDFEYAGDISANRVGTLIREPDSANPVIGWYGPLDANDSVTLTYSVRQLSVGDGVVRNVAWSPQDPTAPETPDCAQSPDPARGEPCATDSFGVPRIQMHKTYTASPETPVPGGKVTYTITAKNTGGAAFAPDRPLVLADNLTDVLDGTNLDPASLQATIDGQAADPPTFDPATAHVYWTGPLDQGATVEIVYTVEITGSGNGLFRNVAWAPRGQNPPPAPGGNPPATPQSCDSAVGLDPTTGEPCSESARPRPLLTLSKTVATEPILGALAGTKVTYTITGANANQAPYTEDNPARVWDDIGPSLEGAVYNDDAIATLGNPAGAPAEQPSFDAAAGILRWEGPLDKGQTVTITYSVTLLPSGPGTLRNVAWEPVDPADPGTTAPACEQPPGDPDDLTTHEVCAAADLARPLLQITKEADQTSKDARYRDTIHYTVTARNVGDADFTTGSQALVRDDLTQTLDDALAPAELKASRGAAPVFDAASKLITWSGTLPVGASVVIEYDVELRDFGASSDQVVVDVAWSPKDQTSTSAPACVAVTGGVDDQSAEPCARVAFKLPLLKITKTTDSAGAGPQVGDHLTFTIDVENVGQAPYTQDRPATLVDSLAGTLADATLVGQPVITPTGMPGDTFIWENIMRYLTMTSVLAVGESRQIVYQVILTSSGDGRIANVAWERTGPSGQNPPTCQDAPDGVDLATGAPCALAAIDFPVLRVAKSSNMPANVTAPHPIDYTVRATNIAPGADFTQGSPAHVYDDLSGIVPACGELVTGSLKATRDGQPTAAQPTWDEATGLIHWEGPLARGDTVVITYQVTYQQCAAIALVNVAWQPADPTGAPEAPVCLSVAGGVDSLTGQPCGRADSPTRTVELTKTVKLVDATGQPVATPRPGDRAVYTITASNAGEIPYTEQVPLVLRDDIAALLQGATLVGDPTATWAPASADPDADSGAFEILDGGIVWRGVLAVGQQVTLSYEAVLTASGLGRITNTVWEPADPYAPNPPAPTCDPADTNPAEACARTEFDRPLLTVDKTSTPSRTPLETGDTVTYTVTFENVGAADFDAVDAPAMLFDSLASLGDGVAYNGDAAVGWDQPTPPPGAVTYDQATQLISWTGPLAVGQKAWITYSVTLRQAGPASLVNVAWAPDTPAESDPPDCATRSAAPVTCAAATETRTLTHIEKTTQGPAAPRAGDRLTYTVHLTNIGDAAYTQASPALIVDDLTELLLNARYNDDAQTTPASGTITVADGRLTWSGPLDAHATVTLTFSVTLTAAAGGAVENLAWSPVELTDPPPDQAVDCPISADAPDPLSATLCAATETRRTNVAITKEVTGPPGVPRTGDLLTYTVKMKNTGTVDFSPQRPAVLVDDLTEVLQTALYLRDASVSYDLTAPSPVPQPVYSAPRITWSGPLAQGQTVTLTYTVRLRGSTVADATNTAWSPADPFSPTPPPMPTCRADGTDPGPLASGVDGATGEACATATLHRALTSIKKSVSPAGTALPGETLTYSITVLNISGADFTDQDEAVVWDDISDVLADADWVADSLTVDGIGTATRTGDLIRWSGALPSGQSAVVSYAVQVRPTSDGNFRNVAWVPLDPEATDPAAPGCAGSNDGSQTSSVASGELCAGLTVTGPSLAIRKQSRPTGTLLPGDIVTYTITASNVGAGPFTLTEPMVILDDLTDLLGEAELVPGSLDASTGAAPTVAEGLLRWSGAVPADTSVTITYQVKLLGGGDGGARNVAWSPAGGGTDPPACDGSETAVCAADELLLPKLTLTKELVTPGPYTQGAVGRYRLTVANTGQAPFTGARPAEVLDDLSGMLDGSVFRGDQTASSSLGGAVAQPTFLTPLLRWSGPLAVGEVVSIEYSVTWRADGDGVIRNIAWQPADPDAPVTPKCNLLLREVDAETGEVCAAVDAHRPLLTLEKTSDGHGRELAPGDKVTYEITATNSGDADYTTAANAVVMDDLSALADGATFNNDLSATVAGETAAPPSYDPATGIIRWAGPLKVDQSVTIKFSITLTGGGNG